MQNQINQQAKIQDGAKYQEFQNQGWDQDDHYAY